ncbi:MAG: hypothetical protein ACP5F6_01300 [Microbacter sp.]
MSKSIELSHVHYKGLPPLNPDFLFPPASGMFHLTQKGSKKVKTTSAFAQKTDVHWLKSSKLAPSSLKQGRFLTANSLVFWLTGRGRSLIKDLL